VQVDPIKPNLTPPGTKRLKPYYYDPPSNFAFNFNLRRYDEEDRLKTVDAFLSDFDRKVRRCRLSG
jgi:hypothetical protein